MSEWSVSPTVDLYLASGAANTNYGTASNLYLGYGSGKGPGIQRILILIDLSGFEGDPDDITAAQLDLYATSVAVRDAAHAYRITQTAWTEASATWNKYDGSTNWTAAGGDYTTTGGVAFNTPSSTGAWSISGLAALAQDAINNRGGALHLLLRVDNETRDFIDHNSSSEHTTSAYRPNFVIEYTEAASGVTGAVALIAEPAVIIAAGTHTIPAITGTASVSAQPAAITGTGSVTSPPSVTLVQDSFNRSDGALGDADSGQAWLYSGNKYPSISTNRLAGSGTGAGYAYIDAGEVAYAVSAKVLASGAVSGLRQSIVYRGANDGDWWLTLLYWAGGSDYRIYTGHYESGTLTSSFAYSSVSATAGNWYELKIIDIGTAIQVYWESGLIATFNSTLHNTGTRVGIYCDSSGLFMDDFLAESEEDSSITGAVAVTAQAAEMSASGTYTPAAVTGTVTLAAQAAEVASAGTYTAVAITGVVSVTAVAGTLSAAGTYTPLAITGTVSLFAQLAEVVAAGTYTAEAGAGSISLVAQAAEIAIAGTYTPPSGTGAITLVAQAAAAIATGTYTPAAIAGVVAVTAVAATISASGSHASPTNTGTVAVTAEPATIVASGTHTAPAIAGVIAVTAPPAQVIASAVMYFGYIGSISVQASPAEASLVGSQYLAIFGRTGTTGVYKASLPLVFGGIRTVATGMVAQPARVAISEAPANAIQAWTDYVTEFRSAVPLVFGRTVRRYAGMVAQPAQVAATGTITDGYITGHVGLIAQPAVANIEGTYTPIPISGSVDVTAQAATIEVDVRLVFIARIALVAQPAQIEAVGMVYVMGITSWLDTDVEASSSVSLGDTVVSSRIARATIVSSKVVKKES